MTSGVSNEGGNDTRDGSLLTECAHGTNQNVKLRTVLPRRAQWNQSRVPFLGWRRSKLERKLYLDVLLRRATRSTCAQTPRGTERRTAGQGS